MKSYLSGREWHRLRPEESPETRGPNTYVGKHRVHARRDLVKLGGALVHSSPERVDHRKNKDQRGGNLLRQDKHTSMRGATVP